MKRTRMYEPWGYQEENDFISNDEQLEIDLSSMFADAKYNKSDNKIHFFNEDGEEKCSIDVSEFEQEEIVESAYYDESTKEIVIEFSNGDVVRINAKELIDETEFKDGLEVSDGQVKVLINSAESDDYISVDAAGIKLTGVKRDIDAEEARATSAETDLQAAIESEGQRAQDAETVLDGKIDNSVSSLTAAVAAEETRATGVEALKANAADVYTKEEVDDIKDALLDGINVNANAILAERDRAISAETDLEVAVSGKADADTVYTQEEVDALLLAKENEIYNLTKIVGDMGGAVTYEYPNEAGKSLTTLLGNSGTVKLTDDATISRFGPGITAKNKVNLNLNNHDITSTSAGSYGAIMSRGTQEITIYGKGTIDSVDGICIEANGAGCTINLTGSTTVYQNDRSGGELIYCYAGTINITNGTFKNNGEDKKYLLNCYDANYAAGTAKIIVSGGKFYDFNPADNSAEGEHTNFLAPGYHVEISTDGDSTIYTVKKDA